MSEERRIEIMKDLIKDPDFFKYCFFCDMPLFDGMCVVHSLPCCEECAKLYRTT